MIILSQIGLVANALHATQTGNLGHHTHTDIIAQSRYNDYDYVDDEYSMEVPFPLAQEHQICINNSLRFSPPIQNRRRPANRDRWPAPSQSSWVDLLKNQRQLGATLLGVGLLLTLMGIMLFFEGNLLRLGNIGIIAGIVLLIGPGNVSAFFMKESRLQATVITSIGILLVFWGKPKLGLLIEIFGLLNLFGNMFPVILAVGRSIPGIGDIIVAFEGSSSSNDRRNYKNDYDRRAPPRRPEPRRPVYTPEAGPGKYDPEF